MVTSALAPALKAGPAGRSIMPFLAWVRLGFGTAVRARRLQEIYRQRKIELDRPETYEPEVMGYWYITSGLNPEALVSRVLTIDEDFETKAFAHDLVIFSKLMAIKYWWVNRAFLLTASAVDSGPSQGASKLAVGVRFLRPLHPKRRPQACCPLAHQGRPCGLASSNRTSALGSVAHQWA